jgi:hypothetical protein
MKLFFGTRGFCIKLLQNKYLEIEWDFDKNWREYFNVWANWTRKQDHAGASIGLDLIGFHVSIKIYDSRHWDYKLETWER